MINRNEYYRMLLICVIVSLVSLCVFCSEPLTGGGSEAGNARITGMIKSPNGYPAVNTIVTLLPSDYNHVTDSGKAVFYRDTTSSDGTYQFEAKENSTYSIEAVQQTTRFRALISKLQAAVIDDTVPECTLSVPGTVSIIVPEEDKEDSGYVYVPGTTLSVKFTSKNSCIEIDSVPSGILPEIYYMSIGDTQPALLRSDVAVLSGDTVTVMSQKNWLHSARLILNTAASGADIGSDVHDFPILVRLNTGNFNFSQARHDGGDIRFTTLKGIALPYEIELWDSTAERAAIWVKVDTIRGGNASQSIIMYWGNPAVSALGGNGVVFDTSIGFDGVWHLGDAAAGHSKDATVNRYNGTSPDSARPSDAGGIIGNCNAFDGMNDFITMPNTASGRMNFSGTANYTISAWISIDTLDELSHAVVAKGYDQYFLRLTYFPSGNPLWEFSQFADANNWQSCTTSAYSKKWSLLTGVQSGNKHLLYLDGTLVDSIADSYSNSSLSRNTSYDITIGKFTELVNQPGDISSYCYYKGSIDEVRIEHRARSNAWLRLCYMNQRIDDRLIVFKDKL